MIGKIIEYCIRGRLVVIMLTAAMALWGVWCLIKTPVDAIPDLSENQVIVFADWMGRSPKEIDDQVTYPLSVNLQGLSGVKVVRSASEFNFAMVTIIFDDSVDFYFARTRVQERLSQASTYLPPGVVPYLAPDATALGQIFWYTVEGEGYSLDELRAIQDWYIRYQLYVPGVAQVASVGGFVREYQVDVDPQKLRAYELTLGDVLGAVERSNTAVGGKVFVETGAEYLIRGVGWLRGVKDIEDVVVAQRNDVPITVSRLATVQLGPEFRRSVLEKNGQEATGGVVMMRHGANPLEVTRAIKQRIEQLQGGLPKGVRIVPFYERTRLIEGAIHTLGRTLTEEIIIASLAVLLILMHFRSAIIICLTLPLAVLVSFILMYYLGIPSNIMSLAGIAISVGILVDASVVMVEHATHELQARYGAARIRGDTTEIVIGACRLVGKPIFFAVLIMLVSFIPVFALGGQEGKMFHPLAFTKTFAMVGVAALAITFVPAMIPLLLKGRLRGEQESWLVRSFINVYKPVLSWLMRVPGAAAWFLAALVLVGAGLAGLGPGAPWWMMALMAVAMLGGCAFFRRFWSRGLALGLLLVVAMVAWRLPKLGSEFMPPLDEGSILDMPVTTPRVSAAQAADDLKARDEVLRSLPEVELAVGKAGRADTPTDPSGLDMVETVITLRPSEYWPKRKVRYEDAAAEASLLAGRLKEAGILRPQLAGAALDNLVGAATMEAVADFDRAMRELARRRQIEHDAALSAELTAASVDDLLALLADKRRLSRQPTTDQRDRLVAELAAAHGELLVTTPRQEEMNLLLTAAAAKLAALGVTDSSPDLLLAAPSAWRTVRDTAASLLGRPTSSVFAEFFERFSRRLHEARIARARMLNWELQDQAPGTLDWLLLSSLREHARRLGELARPADDAELAAMRQRRAGELAGSLQLWPKSKNDLIKELDTELQVPGWGNIWTQPIINRVDMLATGVRTQIGVKVFGPRMEDLTIQQDGGAVVTQKGIQTIANEVAAALKNVPGAVDVFPDQVVGRSYLMVEVNRDKAARYGVNVGDVQQAIEVAMGGKAVTTTVENRQRFAVRVRYARDFWQTEAALRETLVAGRRGESTLLTPISEVADIRRAEGPSVIKSENGQLRAYVQLNVRDRDVMGFVEEAQRVVAQGVALPDGFHIEWGGQFEHQVRARQTLWVIFPVVIALIFVILLVTFNSWRDALLIVLAVPGALAGGIIFQSIFGFNFSVAVWVGFIACFGMATQTGIVMLVYLHDAIRARGGLAAIATRGELTDTIVAGAVHRLRPKLMTEGVAIIGLMPMLWASGVGAEVIKPMAAPVLGGLLVADEVIDLLIPVVFNWYMGRRWAKAHGQPVAGGAGSREPVAGQPGARSR